MVGGVPARVIARTSDVKLRDGYRRAAYPWMRHFHRGYPADVVAGWLTGTRCALKERSSPEVA